MACAYNSVFLICLFETYILHTELSDSVVHQHCYILHRHPHTSVQPAALLWPILTAFFLPMHNHLLLKHSPELTGAHKGHSINIVSMSLTSFLSRRLVNMTMVADLCSQTILQKSATVSGFGPGNRHGEPNPF